MEPLCRIDGRAVIRLFMLLALVLFSVAGVMAEPVDEQTIIDAVKLANALEGQYWDDPGAFRTREQLYAHYRKGYSAAIAERMTDYTLTQNGDAATWVPDEVHVVSIDEDSAVAWFRTPPAFAEHGSWGFQPFMVVRLRREEDRWVIDWATDSATPPS